MLQNSIGISREGALILKYLKNNIPPFLIVTILLVLDPLPPLMYLRGLRLGVPQSVTKLIKVVEHLPYEERLSRL